mmetsp:Transcript_30725/g.27928  ORF Transcript_30725/g.27928 Transcript_30725/m.27928 type:complete len:127 (-) Transcript_30725:1263-1643(-)
MLGRELMIAPFLTNSTKREVYFPSSKWYNFHTLAPINIPKRASRKVSIERKLTDKIPMFIKEESLVLTQDISLISGSRDLDNHYLITCAIGDSGEAIGRILGVKSYNEHTIKKKCENADCILQLKV